jgi:8-oxo-dGDP phosphatase
VGEANRERTQWTINDERLVDENRHVRLSIADVTLPDGVRFEQYVMRLPRAALILLLNERDEVLMIWRHRFIIDRWVWELPGGYVDQPGDDPIVTAAHEVEEETGWRARGLELLTTFQPLVGSVAQDNLVFIGRNGADYIGDPSDINEAERIQWIPLDDVRPMMDRGEIVGAGSVIGLLRVLSERPGVQPAS